MTETPAATVPTCRSCSAPVDPAHRFCESCGAVQAELAQVAVPREGIAAEAPCVECGHPEYADDYCTQCGHRRAEPDRDEVTSGQLFLITDRGIQHASNEDAAAAGTLARDDAPAVTVAIVCDGVSSARDSAAASRSATKIAVAAILSALSAGRPPSAAMLAGLAAAAKAAVDARKDPTSSPSCTFTGAIVVPTDDGVEVTTGNVGDSRTYWLPEAPERLEEAQQLTLDDSLARELMSAGLAADSEAVIRGEHTLTRWLGADADPQPWADDAVKTVTVRGPGTVLVCSDGLWNYLPQAADLAQRCAGTDATTAARALVDFALQSGGQDNITVIMVPIGG